MNGFLFYPGVASLPLFLGENKKRGCRKEGDEDG
jgi:hypothetical protein